MAVKGKVYKSKFKGFRLQTRSEAVVYHPATGVEINRVPALTAEFGVFGDEIDIPIDPEHPEDGTHRGAVITGGYFDTADAAERLGWTDEEHETIINDLDRWCTKWPEAVQLVTRVPAGKPWPTYDDVKADQIAVLAETLGLVVEALAYEQENKARKTVVGALEELLAAREVPVEPVAEESLTAA